MSGVNNSESDLVVDPVDEGVFRDVVGRFVTGVTILTGSSEGRNHGMVVSAFSSLSVDPPMVLVCANRKSRTQDTVRKSGAFGVNVLAEHQHDLVRLFSSAEPEKFSGVLWSPSEQLGLPLLTGVLGWLECRVIKEFEVATHAVFMGEVLGAGARGGAPLAYFRGGFDRLVGTLTDGN
ncbi:flavin reductase (DIM6/NTAB) family NADH-FMN oxidoreductase RutF [Halopolyspora algeriensis]|uniref:Flavin reductase (DIM6/NTAB) family NADH-FMN oxidoreductase RutF n=2 Tax=Halopolyspora algeriensis TaxID=1500506 RepID=A0A368V935_9ACTN|nr:flavin reductase (DIM6/NTAB) family NADH-FMN oxidoreductase RutF [Halopolyspora algeriensis]TQM53819.1 flavin reductase (DIM6/NTAB) family NADH-FMN oxidoreductase RutF [Halopolyspora algeriensis]